MSIHPRTTAPYHHGFNNHGSEPALPECKMRSNARPEGFSCTLTKQLFHDPVFTKCKHVFDRYAFELYLSISDRCPQCKKHIKVEEIRDHKKLKALIQRWIDEDPVRRNPSAIPVVPKVDLSNPEPPSEFICSILQDVTDDPAYLPCKHVFDNDSVRQWLKQVKAECPNCRAQATEADVKLWPALKAKIAEWRAAPKISKKPAIKPDDAKPKKDHVKAQKVQKTDPVPAGEIVVITSLIQLARSMNLKNPKALPNLEGLSVKYPQLRSEFQAIYKQIFGNVYKLQKKETGRIPHHPRFGENAFYRIGKLDVSQKIRQKAICLCALEHIISLFQQQQNVESGLAMRLFSQLPQDVRNGVYGHMHEFLKARGESRQDPKSGQYAFRQEKGFTSSTFEQIAAMESYLQSKF